MAAGSSFVMFAIGAIVPLIPYLLGYGSLWLGLACGGVGLLVAGGLVSWLLIRNTAENAPLAGDPER